MSNGAVVRALTDSLRWATRLAPLSSPRNDGSAEDNAFTRAATLESYNHKK